MTVAIYHLLPRPAPYSKFSHTRLLLVLEKSLPSCRPFFTAKMSGAAYALLQISLECAISSTSRTVQAVRCTSELGAVPLELA